MRHQHHTQACQWLGIAAVSCATVVLASCDSSLTSEQYSAGSAASLSAAPRIVVNGRITFQTISGWEATAQAGQNDSPAFARYRDQLFDAAVDDLGITRLRLAVPSGIEYSSDTLAAWRAGRISSADWRVIRYATVNDNDNPFDLNEAGFWFSGVDDTIEQVVLPIKSRLEARGRQLHLNANYTAFTRQIGSAFAYDHQDPEEYAEFVEATYRHLQTKYGLVPDSWEVELEPDNSRQWTPSFMRRAMLAAGTRLQALGITPRFIAPSTTDMSAATRYADEIASGGLPPFWAELSYHRYRGVSAAALSSIADRATRWNLSTSMLEHIGSGYEDLHEDLRTGRASAWQQFTLAFPTRDNGAQYFTIDDRDPARPRIDAGSRTPFLRQYFRYIQPGAVRVSAVSQTAAVDPLAFINPDGTYVIVVKADAAGSFEIEGLPAGTYQATSTTSRATDTAGGTFTVAEGARLQASIPGRGVLTVFRRDVS